MIASRYTKPEDVNFIVQNASKATLLDLEAAEISSAEIDGLLEQSTVARTITKDDVPVVVMGCRPDGDGWSTWLMYTDEFYRHHEALDEQIRKELDEYPPKFGVDVLRVCTILSMPGSEKWMNGFGFTRLPNTGMGPKGHTFYVMERRY